MKHQPFVRPTTALNCTPLHPPGASIHPPPRSVISRPVVCGVTSLGYDHMELLGGTLPAIAREKAGILKRGVAAWSVPQPDDAFEALQVGALCLVA